MYKKFSISASGIHVVGLLFLCQCCEADLGTHVMQRVGDFENGRCVINGLYAHDLHSFNALDTQVFHTRGSHWDERCRNCTCNVFGAFCTGPVCSPLYDFSQEHWCIRWSSDGCCCTQLGCSVDGVRYAVGEQYPYGQGNPCLMCECTVGTSREHCLSQECGQYTRVCHNSNVTYDEQCCPQYNCPEVPCTEIPDPNPATSRHELLDWYGYIHPIPVGTSRHFHVDTWSTYSCECQGGPVATCHMVSFK